MSLPTTPEEIWKEIEDWPFAVLGFVTSKGEPRAAGILYIVRDRKLYITSGSEAWKVRHIAANPSVSVTVTVQRLPVRIRQVPPAVITFSGRATIYPIEDASPLLRPHLLKGVNPHQLESLSVIEIEPVGRFVTYGIGIPAMQMRHPEKSIARVPVG